MLPPRRRLTGCWPVLQVVHRAIARFLLDQAGLKADEAHSGAVTLIQHFGAAANLNIHRHCPVPDGVYRCSADGAPVLVEVPAPTDEALQAVSHHHAPRIGQRARAVQTNAAGQVVLKLKTSWRDGTTYRVMSPLEFMQRLAALVPRPRLHLIRVVSAYLCFAN